MYTVTETDNVKTINKLKELLGNKYHVMMSWNNIKIYRIVKYRICYVIPDFYHDYIGVVSGAEEITIKTNSPYKDKVINKLKDHFNIVVDV